MNYLKMEPLAGENIYLFRTEDPEAVLKWDSGGASIGDYLTGLLENRVPAQQKEGVTLQAGVSSVVSGWSIAFSSANYAC